MKKRIPVPWVAAVLLAFLLVLNRYGTAIPPAMPPEEVNFAGLAQNLAEGRGAFFAVPSEIVPSPEEHPRRFYAPVLSYAFALSGWGSVWGFDLLPLRWFNRLLGALNLFLLFGLARRWGVSRGLALLAALWTSMDISFQLTSNVVRSDMFCLLWALTGLYAFTEGRENRKRAPMLGSGICFALALFAHFLEAFLLFAWLLGVLFLEKRWRDMAVFLFPSVFAAIGWVLFALQDWPWFLLSLRLMLRDRGVGEWQDSFAYLLGLPSTVPIFGVYPVNSPLWFPILVTLTWAKVRRHLDLSFWKAGTLWAAYLTGYRHGFPFYVGWFTPFGYLALAILSQALLRRKGKIIRGLLLALALIWLIYQTLQVGRCWRASPIIHQAHQRFFQELATTLPPNSSFWLHSVPDPYLPLSRARPDLNLFVGTGYFVNSEDFLQRLDGGIFILGMVPHSLVNPDFISIRREWLLPGVLTDYSVLWVEPLPSQ